MIVKKVSRRQVGDGKWTKNSLSELRAFSRIRGTSSQRCRSRAVFSNWQDAYRRAQGHLVAGSSPGETVFLCGASGAGKTTLLYTLAGLERPLAGHVKFEGEDIYSLSSDRLAGLRNRRMGFVFQAYFLLPELTAFENVTLPSMMGGNPRDPQAASLLERVGLKDRMDHLPSELSGGEQQRVAIARSLINDPSIIYADEPTGKSRLPHRRSRSLNCCLMWLGRIGGRLLWSPTTNISRNEGTGYS